MRISVGVRLVGLGAVGVLGVGVVAAATGVAAHNQARSSERMAQASDAMSQQWNADMLHDGIRGDVMAALYASDDQARELYEVGDVGAKAADMLETFDRAAAGADPSIRAAFASARPDVVTYTETAPQLVRLAGEDKAAAEAQLGDFLTLFGSLEQQLGDIDTALEQSVVDEEEAARASAGRTVESTVAVALAVAVLLALSCWLVVRAVITPVRRVVAGLSALAQQDLTVQVEVSSDDELGEMSRAFNSAVEQLRHTISETGRCVEQLVGASSGLNGISGSLGRTAVESSERAEGVSAAASTVSDAAGAMAAATHEMDQSIREIANRAATAAAVAVEAVGSVEQTTQTVGRLTSASQEIGGILRTITAIAEQTNLLALNATIEAARAGESGRGFAVVATEVKELAQQTAGATEDITHRISAIQSMSAEATTAIERISEVIGRINENQAMIAAAVEQQSATTAEMSRGVDDVTSKAIEIADGAGGIAGGTEATAQGAEQAHQAAEELGIVAGRVTELVGRFRV